jgi:hypothetical protein
MELLSLNDEARIRRAAYIAVLRGEVGRSQTHAGFAHRIAHPRVYLEQLLAQDGLRTPGPKTANEIVQALPLEHEQREDLLEQMLLAAERRLRRHRRARSAVEDGLHNDVLAHIRVLHWDATYSTDASAARARYLDLYAAGELALHHVELVRHPLSAAEVSLVMHDVLSVLNMPGRALVHAMAAGNVLHRLDPADYRRGRERFDHLLVNAPVAEASSLTSLGLARQAEECLMKSEALMRESATAAMFWAMHIARSRLAALSVRNRFSLYSAEELAAQVKAICERRGERLDEQFALQADVALARAYLRYDTPASRRKAHRQLRDPVERLEEVAALGPVKRVIALRTYAGACLAVGRNDESDHFLRRAWLLAELAGLRHQLAAMRRESGARLSALDLQPAVTVSS